MLPQDIKGSPLAVTQSF